MKIDALDLAQRAKEIIGKADAAGLTIDDGNVIDLLADNIPGATLDDLRRALAVAGLVSRFPRASRIVVRSAPPAGNRIAQAAAMDDPRDAHLHLKVALDVSNADYAKIEQADARDWARAPAWKRCRFLGEWLADVATSTGEDSDKAARDPRVDAAIDAMAGIPRANGWGDQLADDVDRIRALDHAKGPLGWQNESIFRALFGEPFRGTPYTFDETCALLEWVDLVQDELKGAGK